MFNHQNFHRSHLPLSSAFGVRRWTFSVFPVRVSAQAPEIACTLPTGIQRGTTATIHIDGKNLAGANLLISGRGVQVDDLYRVWTANCEKQGRDHPGTKQTFGRDLTAAVPGLTIAQPRDAYGVRVRYYEGIGLRTESCQSRSNSGIDERPHDPHWHTRDHR